MSKEQHLLVRASTGYELIDSGEHLKLERYGETLVVRPDTQAIWKQRDSEAWTGTAARFSWQDGKGSWVVSGMIPEPWTVTIDELTLLAKLTSFKHTGIFPEQAANWSWSMEAVRKLEKPSVLNLFGYTGAASVAAAKAGASVTHVDSSKTSIAWAIENAIASGLPEDALRVINEDARSFVKREVRRGTKYQGIILDPPAFGRGAKDEVWKIEEDLLPLLENVKELLSPEAGSFFLLNGYASGYAPASFLQLVESVFPEVDAEYGELRIEERGGRILPTGMYVRFVR